jgi:hypothetical protein
LSDQFDAAGSGSAAIFAVIGALALCAIAAVALMTAFMKRRSRPSSSYSVRTTEATASASAFVGDDCMTFLNPCLTFLPESLGDVFRFDQTLEE